MAKVNGSVGTFILGLFTSCVFGMSSDISNLSCPIVVAEETRLPIPGNCNFYLSCRTDSRKIIDCPTGLDFDPVRRICDLPEKAGCRQGLMTFPEQSQSQKCPKVNPRTAKLLPHESNCHLYYICESGKALLRECPKRLHFNPKELVCDFPERAGCINEFRTPGYRVGLTNKPQSTGAPSPLCPTINGQFPIFFRHPKSCSIYYMCGNGIAYEFTCPSGLHFNLRKKVCDVPYNAQCLLEE